MYAQQIRTSMGEGDRPSTPGEQEMALGVLDYLRKQFPDYPFELGVDQRPHVGMVTIRCTALPPGWGVNIKVDTLNAPGGYKKMRNHVGEMLERFKMRRDRFDPSADPLARPLN